MNKKLIIIRGCPGSGKTTFAEFIKRMCSSGSAVHYEADRWMIDNIGRYQFDAKRLGYCHSRCQNMVEEAMVAAIPVVIVSNTFTKVSEMKVYLDFAAKYGYSVTSLVMEKHHNNKDIHGMNEETLVRMENNLRQSIKLR